MITIVPPSQPRHSNPIASLTSLRLASLLTLLSLVTLAPPTLAQTSGPIDPLNTNDSVDLFDSNSARDFNPLDIIHDINFSRKDPFLFFQEQQGNLDATVLEFRARQQAQLREQGYDVPNASLTPGTPADQNPAVAEDPTSPLLQSGETTLNLDPEFESDLNLDFNPNRDQNLAPDDDRPPVTPAN